MAMGEFAGILRELTVTLQKEGAGLHGWVEGLSEEHSNLSGNINFVYRKLLV